MSKRPKNANRSRGNPQSGPSTQHKTSVPLRSAAIGPSPHPAAKLPAQDVDKLVDAALEAVIAEQVPLPQTEMVPAPPADEWPKVWAKLLEAQASFAAAKGAVDERGERLSQTEAQLDERRVQLEQEEARLGVIRAAWEQERTVALAEVDVRQRELKELELAAVQKDKAFSSRLRDLDARDSVITVREVEAATGFSTWRSEQSQKLSEEVARLRQQSLELAEQITAQQAAWSKEEDELRSGLRMELAQRRAARMTEAQAAADALVGERETSVAQREQRVLEREAKARVAERRLEEERRDIEQEIGTRVDRERQALHGELQREADRRQLLESEVEGLREQATSIEEWQRALGTDPAQARKRMKAAEAKIKDLEDKLARRPLEDTGERLREVQEQLEHTRRALEDTRAELGQLKAKYSAAVIGVLDVDTAKREAESYRVSRDVLAQRLEALRGEVDSARQANSVKSPFEACADIQRDFANRPRISDEPVDLKALVSEVRNRLALGETRLYFSERVIRTFLAGLASSRLVLLEGISGTGKTKLARTVAHVLGAGEALIEVQAGWRDRQDLFGHYNTFERKYHETDFLKALVRAGTPAYRDLPVFIVLDEMNLSHPEQYFADVLSALERGDHEPDITLVPKELENTPTLLGGGKVRILENVWFIGTANQDETTKDFADKTYDRAHVMRLPRHRDEFTPMPQSDRQGALAYASLRDAFARAKQSSHKVKVKDGRSLAEVVVAALENHLANVLDRQFDLGWGNRLERQVGDFVPAYLAAGGRLGEAVDHLVLTKLVRKVGGRHDVESPELDALRTAVHALLVDLDPKWVEEMAKKRVEHDFQSLEVIDREGKKKAKDDNWTSWWEMMA